MLSWIVFTKPTRGHTENKNNSLPRVNISFPRLISYYRPMHVVLARYCYRIRKSSENLTPRNSHRELSNSREFPNGNSRWPCPKQYTPENSGRCRRYSMGLSSFKFSWWAPKDARVLKSAVIQHYPRSLILAPIESVYAISYWSSIVTLVLSCPVSEILQVSWEERPHPYSTRILRVFPLDYYRCCGSEERSIS